MVSPARQAARTPFFRICDDWNVLKLEAFDWNWPQNITPRFTASQIEATTSALRNRIVELEAEVAALRKVD
ncbi:hypothetical protein [Asticcacaulis benevestitus]|nr:hypothetical protein [Asticcacaulis benevestitus]